MLKAIMPSLKALVTTDYQSILTPESEALIEARLQNLSPAKQPMLMQISGIPGSGKSTYCTTHQQTNFLFLSFDEIMTSMVSYQKDIKTIGQVKAYENNEMPARVIGYELLQRALANRLNIMLEHSGTNPAHLELFQNIRQFGYQTEVVFITCDIDTAINRAKERAEKIHRYVPEELIRERAKGQQTYIEEYKKICDKVTVCNGMDGFKKSAVC